MPTYHTRQTWFTHIPSSPHPTCTFITHFTIQFQFNKKWCSCTLNYSGYWFCINQLNIEHCTEALTILHPLQKLIKHKCSPEYTIRLKKMKYSLEAIQKCPISFLSGCISVFLCSVLLARRVLYDSRRNQNGIIWQLQEYI